MGTKEKHFKLIDRFLKLVSSVKKILKKEKIYPIIPTKEDWVKIDKFKLNVNYQIHADAKICCAQQDKPSNVRDSFSLINRKIELSVLNENIAKFRQSFFQVHADAKICCNKEIELSVLNENIAKFRQSFFQVHADAKICGAQEDKPSNVRDSFSLINREIKLSVLNENIRKLFPPI